MTNYHNIFHSWNSRLLYLWKEQMVIGLKRGRDKTHPFLYTLTKIRSFPSLTFPDPSMWLPIFLFFFSSPLCSSFSLGLHSGMLLSATRYPLKKHFSEDLFFYMLKRVLKKDFNVFNNAWGYAGRIDNYKVQLMW